MDLSSKFTLYDVLAMIIPGGIIMEVIGVINWVPLQEFFPCQATLIKCCCGCVQKIVSIDNGVIESVWWLSAAYLIGLINNWLCDGVFRGFRNYSKAIDNEYIRVSNKFKGVAAPHATLTQFFNRMWICGSTLWNMIKVYCPCIRSDRSESERYYKAYYALSESNRLGSIPFIEAQVSLLRNSMIPLSILLVMTAGWIIGLGTLIIMYAVMIQRQNKVYYIVWESVDFYKIMH